jgi:hypothetical protein
MNKAFVREPDQGVDYCPRCGSKGQEVRRETILSYLPAGQKPAVADPANFCPAPLCEVAYFDSFERVVLTGELNGPVYPKDPDAPLCACFGLTRQDIEQDVREGITARVKGIIEKAQLPEACCATMAANGQPCVAYLQKCYMQCRAEASRRSE